MKEDEMKEVETWKKREVRDSAKIEEESDA
jgi:hypothetical protein